MYRQFYWLWFCHQRSLVKTRIKKIVMTFYLIREQNLNKMIEKNTLLYKTEYCIMAIQ